MTGTPARRMVSWWRLFRLCLASACLLLVTGFGLFVRSALQAPELPPVSDGIVALTGGNGRVETSLSLLEEGRGRLLLVSGVDPHVALKDLAPGLSAEMASRVTLGREATSTAGNAAETKRWVRANSIRSLIVVTAGYHMWRAELEISRSIPGVNLRPYPVQPPALKRRFTRGTWQLLGREYGKFLLVCIAPVRVFRHTVDAS
ncbi:YdcF family protein [Acetobacter conturbans]|uniref:YdcF family protein n=1 Tax=Acetobacter conturbans TaxID=1737472 RepID=A0ABX0JX81_9PROT|nr:YdcF family protein [Acetobacter conturbans]NHN87156.1 YdcF family protein [Acetobacter conturbans]